MSRLRRQTSLRVLQDPHGLSGMGRHESRTQRPIVRRLQHMGVQLSPHRRRFRRVLRRTSLPVTAVVMHHRFSCWPADADAEQPPGLPPPSHIAFDPALPAPKHLNAAPKLPPAASSRRALLLFSG
eukprot:5504811-Pleurochrysis_carterae.AAC.1